jgi:hypothetical protein
MVEPTPSCKTGTRPPFGLRLGLSEAPLDGASLLPRETAEFREQALEPLADRIR